MSGFHPLKTLDRVLCSRMAFLRDLTSRLDAAILRWPRRPSVFNSKVTALFSVAFAISGILQIADADYFWALISFVNTLFFGFWARALWKHEHS